MNFRLASYFFSISLFLSSLTLDAQVAEQCRFDQLHKKRMTEDPGFSDGVKAARKQIDKILFEQQQQLIQPTSGAQYQIIDDVLQIPVVVHVVHTGTAVGVGANIAQSQIDSAIIALNDRFRKTPGTHGDASGVDTKIQFVLASRDPDCNSSTGVVRVNGSSVTNYASQGISAGVTSGADEVDVKNLSRWPNSDYMNIWVVSEIENNNAGFGIQGYAYFPGASAVVDGLVVQHSSFGISGTVNSWNNLNRTVTHEVGHYLGLYHTFEGDSSGVSCPPVTNGCGTGLGDCVTDTEPHIRSSSNCPTGSTNTCTGGTVGLVIRNYMDYSSQTCADMYTTGQKSVMRSALFGPRRSLLSSQSYLAPDTLTLANASCTPQTTNLSNLFAIGVTNVTLDSLNVTSPGSVSDSGYVDRTCSQVEYLEASTTYKLSITTGPSNDEDVRVYIDYNGDGDFLDTLELVYTNDSDTHHTGTITTPSNVVFNEKLRMRVLSEWHGLTANLNIGGSCYNPTYGQAEDFAIVFEDTTTTPSAGCASTTNGTWNVSASTLWSCGVIPDSTVDVVISSGDSVAITSNATVNKLRIENNGILFLAAGVELVIKGDSLQLEGGSQGGKLNCSSGSFITMRGQAGNTQYIVNEANDPLRFANLILNNADDVELASGGDFELTEGLFFKNDPLVNNADEFTFISDSVSTGHIAEFVSTAGISGNDVTIQRYVSSRLAEWNSVGVSGVVTDLEDLDGEIATSGFTGTDTPSGSASIQYWDNSSNQYVTPTNTSDSFLIGRGYQVWLDNSSGQWTGANWDVSGEVNTDETNLDVNSGGAGWNFLANPFPAFLDFQTINDDYSEIVGDEFWYYDADSVTFNARGPNTFIPPGQGFWIKWSSGSGTMDLDLTNHIRSDLGTSELFKREIKEQLKLIMMNESRSAADAIYIRKQVSTTAQMDDEDIPIIQLPTTKAVSLSMNTSGYDLMVNHVDPLKSHEIILQASVTQPGKYHLKLRGTRHFTRNYCLSLIVDGQTIDLVKNSATSVHFEDDKLSKNMILRLDRKEQCEKSDEMMEFASVYSDSKTIIIKPNNPEALINEIEVFNSIGAKVFGMTGVRGLGNYRLNLNDAPSGIYLVRIAGLESEYVEKVVLH